MVMVVLFSPRVYSTVLHISVLVVALTKRARTRDQIIEFGSHGIAMCGRSTFFATTKLSKSFVRCCCSWTTATTTTQRTRCFSAFTRSRIYLLHHKKLPGEDIFAFTPLCLLYQIGDVCPDGDGCRNNHRSRNKLATFRDEETKLKIGKTDSLFTAVLK